MSISLRSDGHSLSYSPCFSERTTSSVYLEDLPSDSSESRGLDRNVEWAGCYKSFRGIDYPIVQVNGCE